MLATIGMALWLFASGVISIFLMQTYLDWIEVQQAMSRIPAPTSNEVFITAFPERGAAHQ
jgi:hypothetical protein